MQVMSLELDLLHPDIFRFFDETGVFVRKLGREVLGTIEDDFLP